MMKGEGYLWCVLRVVHTVKKGHGEKGGCNRRDSRKNIVVRMCPRLTLQARKAALCPGLEFGCVAEMPLGGASLLRRMSACFAYTRARVHCENVVRLQVDRLPVKTLGP